MPRAAPARIALTLTVLAALAAASACSDRKPRRERAEQDPAISAALNEQLMTDPDLARSNPENRALAGGGPASAAIPLEDRSPEAIARARADARQLLGGRAPTPAPPPASGAGPDLGHGGGATAALTAIAALGGDAAARSCAARLEYGFVWAARMPQAVPIYPRGHAQEAAGTDRDGCALRVVNFLTPVPAAEVIDFYWTVAGRASLPAQHRLAGSDHAVIARGKAGQAVVFVRTRADGLTEVDLVTSRL